MFGKILTTQINEL